MKLFLQILSVVAIVAILTSYLAYRRCLRREYAEKKTPEALKHEANSSLLVMFIAIAVVVVSALVLRSL